MALASGMTVPAIARLVAADGDTVRDVMVFDLPCVRVIEEPNLHGAPCGQHLDAVGEPVFDVSPLGGEPVWIGA